MDWWQAILRHDTLMIPDDGWKMSRSGVRIFLVLSIVCLFSLLVQGQNGCRVFDYLKCMKNKALTGHVISTFSMLVPALQPCQSKCFNEPKCISYNLGPVEGHARSCELSTADHSTRPTFLETKPGHEYCQIRNPCMSNPCPAGRLCTPDFAWNTFNCDDGGWSQWGAWKWSQCSLPAICVPTRERACSDPAPVNHGLNCSGPAIDTRQCPPLPIVNITGCKNALGMGDKQIIKDDQINSTSYASNIYVHQPKNGRLNKVGDASGIAGWAAGGGGIGEYIQIDLGVSKVITMVATQGRGDCCPQWVTKYSLAYSDDNSEWKQYEGDCNKIFPGNSDKNTIVENVLEVPIRARYIRLIIQGFQGWATIRMEFYGCTQLCP